MSIAPKSTSTSLWSKFCIFLSDWAFVFVKMTCGLAHPCQTSEPVPINILSLNRVTFACIIYFAVIFFLHKIIETKTNPSPFYVRKVKKLKLFTLYNHGQWIWQWYVESFWRPSESSHSPSSCSIFFPMLSGFCGVVKHICRLIGTKLEAVFRRQDES